MNTFYKATFAAIVPLALGACATASLSEDEAQMQSSIEAQDDVREHEIASLNELTSIYIDAAALYKDAAQIPDESSAVQPTLNHMAQERRIQRDALQDRVLALGGEPDEYGELLGAGHRVFTQMRTVVDSDTEVAIEEVLRGERYILAKIDEASEHQLTPATRDLLIDLKDSSATHIAQLEQLDNTL